MTRAGLWAWAVVALAGVGASAAPAAGEEAVESVIDEIVQVAEKYTSVSARTTIVRDTQTAFAKVKSQGHGTYESLIKGSKVMFRMQFDIMTTYESADGKKMAEQKMTQVGDGDFIYQLSEQGPQKEVLKIQCEAGNTNIVNKAFFKSLRNVFDLKAMPDDKIEGQDVWTLRATPREPEKFHEAWKVYQFRKDNGVLVKTASIDREGKAIESLTLSDVKVGLWISPDRFVFQAPPGVPIRDFAKQIGTSASQPAK